MQQRLQNLNADQRLAVWMQGIADRRNSGKGVKHWCQENSISEKIYYYWQRRIFRTAQEHQDTEFAELYRFRLVSLIAVFVEISGVNMQVYTGADEPTLSALFRVMSLC